MLKIHPSLQKRFFSPDPQRCQVWSNGGGVQSAAIASLICRGEIIAPKYAILVNTERENGEVWKYQEKYVRPALERAGVMCYYPKKTDYTDVDVFDRTGKWALMPLFTTFSGEKGKLRQHCTSEWKIAVFNKFLTEIRAPVKRDVWLGISFDELSRIKIKSQRKNDRYLYPLVALRLRRQDCVLQTSLMGWPKAPRSACWCCPHHCDREWLDMKKNRPEEFTSACDLEKEIQKTDSKMFFHSSCVPLGEVDFMAHQGFFSGDGCASGVCFT